ncbi:MAG: glycoside hydrolase family 10 protein [Geitlerinemataceae cyanobacterium]
MGYGFGRRAVRQAIAAIVCFGSFGAIAASGLVPTQADRFPGGAIAAEAEAEPDPPSDPQGRKEPQEMQELRGVWLTNIDSEVLFSRRALDRGLTRLARLNFNTVYPAVWNWGYTLYPSDVAEETYGVRVDPHPGLRRRDMLAEAVDRGRELDLRVVPWFEFGFQAPSDSRLAERKPEWLTQKADGSQTRMEGDHERVWLNPFMPEVQDFIIALVVELVENYDIDGIQFDDHMGLPAEYGYDPYTIALYRAEHDGNDPPQDHTDSYWVAWRADKITQFMRRLFFAVKAVDNEAVISVSPNPQSFAYSRYLQDWERWERMGLIEELIVQLYRRDLESFESQLQAPELLAARDHIPTAIGVLAGLRNRPADTELMGEQIEAVRANAFNGVAFFFYESLWQWSDDSEAEREAAIGEWFEEDASAPTVYDP